MTAKLSISVTDLHARVIEEAVASGQYASASEVVRAALRHWLREQHIDDLIDEGIASGFGEPDEPIESLIAEARAGFQAKARA